MEVKERIKPKKSVFDSKGTKAFLECAAYFVFGFALSAGKAIGGIRPFGISLIAVSKNKNILFSFLGAVAGYIIGGINIDFARCLASCVLALIGAVAACAFDLNARPAFPVTVAFFADFLSGFTVNINLNSPYPQFIATFGEALLCCGAAFFFSRSINSGYKRIRLLALPVYDLASIIISFSLVVMNLSYFTVNSVSPARALAIAAVLLTLRLDNLRLGLVFALSAGFAFSLSENGGIFMLGALAISYLLSSVFFEYSFFAAGASFLLSTAFFCIFSESKTASPFFLETLFATLIFLLMPSKINRRLEELREKRSPDDSSLRQSLVLKLRFASGAMAAISESVDAVREKINDITRLENSQNRLNMSDEEYIRREIVLEKTNQIRAVASDQFYSISGMLEDLAFEFDEAETFDSDSAEKIRKLLADYDIFPKNISAIIDKFSRMRVEILFDSSAEGIDNPVFQEEIGKICSRYFERGIITDFSQEKMLSFSERPSYKIEIGFAQHCAEGKLCGDTVKIINNCNGRCILIISDGMGKGSRAALDGAMGAGLISKLINAGFGFDSALKTVNSALLVKSNDESLATLDIASIDMFTGKVEFYKAGAPASYLIKNQSISKCELSSMPAGILRGVEFAKKSAVLKPGESVVLMSDGISELGDDQIEKMLLSGNGLSSQQKAQAIIEEAQKIMTGKKTDDMSIIIAKSERN